MALLSLMRPPPAIIASLLGLLAISNDSKPFDLDSTASTYPFVVRVVGASHEQGGSVIVDVSGGVVGSQIPSDLGDDGIAREISVAFGLGSRDSDSWSFDHETPAQPVAPSLRPGETQKIDVLHFAITGLDTVPLADRWLVVQLRVQQHLPGIQAGLLTSYACAEDNLRGATPESRARARRMRSNYSNIC